MLTIGLGNFGTEYENTRHNLGFLIVDKLAEKLGFEWVDDQYLQSSVAKDTEQIILKPLTFVNNSGEAIMALDKRGEVNLENLIVIHDDTEIPFGEVRVKRGGTSGGHNGIKSIDDAISPDYWRVRVGVGRPKNSAYDLADYVLASFTAEEQKLLPDIVDQVSTYLLQSIKDKQLTAKTFKVNAEKN